MTEPRSATVALKSRDLHNLVEVYNMDVWVPPPSTTTPGQLSGLITDFSVESQEEREDRLSAAQTELEVCTRGMESLTSFDEYRARRRERGE